MIINITMTITITMVTPFPLPPPVLPKILTNKMCIIQNIYFKV